MQDGPKEQGYSVKRSPVERLSQHCTDEGPQSRRMQHLHIASCRLTPLHYLKLNCAIEGKSTLDHDGASSTVPRRKHLQWNPLVMRVTLKVIRTIQVTFILFRE